MQVSLWMSTFVSSLLALFVWLVAEPSWKWLALIPALYGAGAMTIAWRWPADHRPSRLMWWTGVFFAAFPIVFGILQGGVKLFA